MDLGLRGGGTVGHDACKTYLYICEHLHYVNNKREPPSWQ